MDLFIIIFILIVIVASIGFVCGRFIRDDINENYKEKYERLKFEDNLQYERTIDGYRKELIKCLDKNTNLEKHIVYLESEIAEQHITEERLRQILNDIVEEKDEDLDRLKKQDKVIECLKGLPFSLFFLKEVNGHYKLTTFHTDIEITKKSFDLLREVFGDEEEN